METIRRPLRLGTLLICVLPLACQREITTPLRFIDRVPGSGLTRLDIAGESKTILPGSEFEQRFSLEGAPTRPVLEFAVGVAEFPNPPAVRFEVLLEPEAGDPVSLYSREIDRVGWNQERIDLSGRDLSGARLVFRRSVLRGFEHPPPQGAWGHPMLLPAEPARKPSVILVSLDTLRADMVGIYGRKQARTPELDQLAESGVMYERAYAPSTWTVPSHASLFYGAHLPYTPAALRESGLVPASVELPDRPIAEILRAAGYRTAAFTGGGFLAAAPWDYSRGFDTYFAYAEPVGMSVSCSAQRFDGPEVFRRAIQWLEENHRDPFFLFVHTYDVHDRCPFYEPGALAPGAEFMYPAQILARADPQKVLDYYDWLIEGVDRKMGDLLAAVDVLGLRDDTLLIVTSDHGEALGENGTSGHACDLKPYEGLARVPLLVRFPARLPAGGRVSAPVTLIDVVPSLLALLGLPPEQKSAGVGLPGLRLPDERGPSQPVYTHCGDALAVWRDNHKLITSRERRHGDEVYDLSRDPGERVDLGEGDPHHAQLAADAAAYWKQAVVGSDAPATSRATKDLDPETRQRLRALGYLK
jgi:arylsulfatase A-like enzyme